MFNINNLKDIINFIPDYFYNRMAIPYGLSVNDRQRIKDIINAGAAVELMTVRMRLEEIAIVAVYRGTQPTIYVAFPTENALHHLKSHYEAEKAKARRLAAKDDFRKSKKFEEWAKSFIVPGDILQFTGTRSYSLRKVIKHERDGIYGQQLDNSRKEVGMTTTNGYDKISKIWTGKEYVPIRKVYEEVVGK